MTSIHPSAVIESGAKLGENVVVGPFCFIESGAVIGNECALDSHVTIKKGTTLGQRNQVFQGAILGGNPQDRRFKDDETFLTIGDDNVIREYVTIHRATGAGKSTTVGNRCFLMAHVHLGHNCAVHDDVTITNNVGCAGHVTIESLANLGGMTGVHQWVRIGRAAMVGGMSRITRDVPPFCIVEGDNKVWDINAIGLRRIGVGSEERLALHKAVKLLFKTQLGLSHAIEAVERDVPMTKEVVELLNFVKRWYEGKNGRGDQR